MSYIPTSNTPALVIQSLNDHIGRELALPGTWSPTLFYSDLKEYPVKSKDELAKAVYNACLNYVSYSEFFENTRGKPRPCTPLQERLLNIYNSGSLMLYFEKLFIELFEAKEITHEIEYLLLYLKALADTNIANWNNILRGMGASDYQAFAKDPMSYARILVSSCQDSSKF